MATATPTIHNPTNFNPADYTVVDYLDNKRPVYCGGTVEEYAQEVAWWTREMTQTFGADYTSKIHRCIHCGNGMVRWITAVLHIPTNETVVFGCDCTARLQFPNQDTFKLAQIQSRAKAREVRIKIYLKREKFLAAHPEVTTLINEIGQPVHAKNFFAMDVINKLNQYGELSDRQLTALVSSMQRDHQFAARKAAEALEPKGEAPSGRVVVTGVVVSTKDQWSDWGLVTKMLVKLNNNAKVWVTAPAGVHRNDTVTVRATWTPKEDDKTFAFGARPHLVSVVPALQEVTA